MQSITRFRFILLPEIHRTMKVNLSIRTALANFIFCALSRTSPLRKHFNNSEFQNDLNLIYGVMEDLCVQISRLLKNYEEFLLLGKSRRNIKKFLEDRYDLKIKSTYTSEGMILLLAFLAYGLSASSTSDFFLEICSKLTGVEQKILTNLLSTVISSTDNKTEKLNYWLKDETCELVQMDCAFKSLSDLFANKDAQNLQLQKGCRDEISNGTASSVCVTGIESRFEKKFPLISRDALTFQIVSDWNDETNSAPGSPEQYLEGSRAFETNKKRVVKKTKKYYNEKSQKKYFDRLDHQSAKKGDQEYTENQNANDNIYNQKTDTILLEKPQCESDSRRNFTQASEINEELFAENGEIIKAVQLFEEILREKRRICADKSLQIETLLRRISELEEEVLSERRIEPTFLKAVKLLRSKIKVNNCANDRQSTDHGYLTKEKIRILGNQRLHDIPDLYKKIVTERTLFPSKGSNKSQSGENRQAEDCRKLGCEQTRKGNGINRIIKGWLTKMIDFSNNSGAHVIEFKNHTEYLSKKHGEHWNRLRNDTLWINYLLNNYIYLIEKVNASRFKLQQVLETNEELIGLTKRKQETVDKLGGEMEWTKKQPSQRMLSELTRLNSQLRLHLCKSRKELEDVLEHNSNLNDCIREVTAQMWIYEEAEHVMDVHKIKHNEQLHKSDDGFNEFSRTQSTFEGNRTIGRISGCPGPEDDKDYEKIINKMERTYQNLFYKCMSLRKVTMEPKQDVKERVLKPKMDFSTETKVMKENIRKRRDLVKESMMQTLSVMTPKVERTVPQEFAKEKISRPNQKKEVLLQACRCQDGIGKHSKIKSAQRQVKDCNITEQSSTNGSERLANLLDICKELNWIANEFSEITREKHNI
ncbi:hypothetical protein ACOME3_004773 [Neoechinorhynchus agilis]